ncbi:hypothetical protein Agabi119p4_4993 [Agaricus bisporus var. burnettii]|uniref:Integrase catalytic domain-containing protein n=1 Tax=Agaricus bisporus var. burnettii TaxID=192524 RepID=A0A8H7F491_AGABI|nr:hypothetical protein Agabi119p4_4993 [Agaricus bisporus var. burnettii]
MANDLQLVEWLPPAVECVTPVESMPPATIEPLWDPPEQIVCKLIEIRLLFLEKLDYLSYVLSDTHPSQEATKILQNIRKLAGNSARELSRLTYMDNACLATMYLTFLDTLQKKGELKDPLDRLLFRTTMAWHEMETVQQAMVVLRGELGSAMCRITTAQMGDECEGALKSPLFAIDNIEVIAELFDAIDECIELLPPWVDYYLHMANDRILNREPVCRIPPSEEEIRAMEAKWKSFEDASYSRIQEQSYLEARIQNLPRDYGRPRFWRRACKVLRRVSVKRSGQSVGNYTSHDSVCYGPRETTLNPEQIRSENSLSSSSLLFSTREVMPPKAAADLKGKRPMPSSKTKDNTTLEEQSEDEIERSPSLGTIPTVGPSNVVAESSQTFTPNTTSNSRSSGQPPNPHTSTSYTRRPIVSELSLIPMNIWTDPPLRRVSSNWKPWSSQMILILRTYKAYAYVEGTEIRPHPDDQVSLANWRANHYMVFAFMLIAIEVNERYDFNHHSKANELWRSLVAVYDVTGIMSKMDAMSQLMTMSFTWNVPVVEHYRNIINLANTIFQDGALSKDDIILHSLLLSLNNDTTKDDMKHARTLLDSKPNAGHSDIFNSLSIAESERKFREMKSNELTALIASTRNANSNSSSSTTNNKKAKPLLCANCKKRGHEEAFCILPKGGMEGKTLQEARTAQRLAHGDGKGNNDKKSFKFKDGKALFMNDGKVYSVDESGNVTAISESVKDVASFVTDSLCEADFDELSLALDDSYISLAQPNFLLDTGCTVHMSPFASDFSDLRPTKNRRITGVNGTHIDAIGTGNITIYTPNSSIILHDALYVPDASVRLISVAALVNTLRGTVTFDNSKVTILDANNEFIASGTKVADRNLWCLDGNTHHTDSALLSITTPTLDVWHRRLGHSNNQSIYEMATKQLAEGMQIDTSLAPHKCDHCILGKQSRTPVPDKRHGERSRRRLGIVFVDLSGPEDVTSSRGNNYFMSIIDDFSNYIWTIPLSHKSDSFPSLKTWALQVERECGERIGVIRIDNGELKSKEMTTWCESNGYRNEFTAPYTSAHIGKVERVHRTLINKARTMRIQTDLPTNQWDEFIQTATYLTVRTLTRSTGKTPYEGWFNKKPNLSHLREIGSRAFTLILNRNNPKILARSIECVLIGYSDNSPSYRLYHRATHKVITSFHVNFIESFQTPRSTTDTIVPTDQDTLATLEEEDINLVNMAYIGKETDEEEHHLTKKERKEMKRERRKWRRAMRSAVKEEKEIIGEEQSFMTTDINPHAPNDPRSLEEALAGPDSHLWKPSIQDELQSLKERDVYQLIPTGYGPRQRVPLCSWALRKAPAAPSGLVDQFSPSCCDCMHFESATLSFSPPLWRVSRYVLRLSHLAVTTSPGVS